MPNVIFIFSILVFNPDPGVDPKQVLGHRSSGVGQGYPDQLSLKNIRQVLKKNTKKLRPYFFNYGLFTLDV